MIIVKVCVIFCCLIFGLVSQRGKSKSFEFHQSDYNVQFERLDLDHYNGKYVKYARFNTFKYNRTCPVMNASFAFKSDLGTNMEIIVQAYKFMSNEYRYFPLRFEVNFCQALSKNLIGVANICKCGNFTGCPLRKNVHYHICHWTIDQSQFPPLIPNGKYMVDLQALIFGDEIALLRLYITISRPLTKKGSTLACNYQLPQGGLSATTIRRA